MRIDMQDDNAEELTTKNDPRVTSIWRLFEADQS